MAKVIEFTYDDVDYTLEYTRKSIEAMEKRGFKIAEVEDKPMTMLPSLFAGAFIAHHKDTPREKIDAIFARMTDKETLITKLADMYNEPFEALLSDNAEGNLNWGANW